MCRIGTRQDTTPVVHVPHIKTPLVHVPNTTPINKLRVMSFNVEGLSPEIDDPSFLDLVNAHDICILTETWRGTDANYSQIRPKHNRAIRHSGGMPVIVKNETRK